MPFTFAPVPQRFAAGQLVRYVGGDTSGAYVHGDILRIESRRGGEFYDVVIVDSSRPGVVGARNILPPHVAEELSPGRPMSPAAFRQLGRAELRSE